MAFALLLLAQGCNYHMGSASVYAIHELPVEHAPGKIVEGKACTWIDLAPNLGRAMNRALDQAPGANALVDVSIRYHVEMYIVVQRQCIYLTGEAVTIEGRAGR